MDSLYSYALYQLLYRNITGYIYLMQQLLMFPRVCEYDCQNLNEIHGMNYIRSMGTWELRDFSYWLGKVLLRNLLWLRRVILSGFVQSNTHLPSHPNPPPELR